MAERTVEPQRLPRPSEISRHGDIPWEMHEACRGWGCVECEGMGFVPIEQAEVGIDE